MTVKMNPVYEDEKKGLPVSLNKITLSPHTDRECTYLLKAHVGKEGREKDANIFRGLMKLQDVEEAAAFDAFMEDGGLQDIAIMALDLDDEWNDGILDTLTLMDLFEGLMDAMAFRSNADRARQAQVEAAEKK